MIRRSVAAYRNRVREELQLALTEDHTPQQIAVSFAFGAFVTMLPTLGTGLLLFVAVAALVDQVSKVALFASVVVFNPVLKWGVYGASFWLGSALLGPVAYDDVSVSAGPDVLLRLLVGNLLLAVVVAIGSYVVALRFVREYRRRSLEVADLAPEPLVDRPQR